MAGDRGLPTRELLDQKYHQHHDPRCVVPGHATAARGWRQTNWPTGSLPDVMHPYECTNTIVPQQDIKMRAG
jgi:hypothetical protein